MAQVLPGIHRIESVFDNRLVASHLLRGEHSVLVDSGFPHTAKDTILPYLDSIGLRHLDWLVITHASGDHFGGNAAVKRHFPQVKIIAHDLDAESIAHHKIFVREHVALFQKKGVPLADLDPKSPEFIRLHGPEVRVDQKIQETLRLDLNDGWQCSLMHAPGHTPGHLIVFDHLHRALVSGDALMGRGIPNLEGQLEMPPHYFGVDWYLQTIKRVRELEPEYLFATHYPPLQGNDVRHFLDESEEFVRHFERQFLDALSATHRLLTIPEMIQISQELLGIPGATYQYGMLVAAHLENLRLRGYVKCRKIGSSPHWIVNAA